MSLAILPPLQPERLSVSRDERGFSLIEVVIAIGILSIGLLGMAAMQSMALMNKTYSNGISQAMREVNQSTAERLLSLPMDDAELTVGNHGPTTSTDLVYSTIYTVTPNTPVVGVNQVVITTSWNDFKGPHSVTLAFTKDDTL